MLCSALLCSALLAPSLLEVQELGTYIYEEVVLRAHKTNTFRKCVGFVFVFLSCWFGALFFVILDPLGLHWCIFCELFTLEELSSCVCII